MELWHILGLIGGGLVWSFKRYDAKKEHLVTLIQAFETACMRLGENWVTADFQPVHSAYNDIRNYQLKYFPLLPIKLLNERMEQVTAYHNDLRSFPALQQSFVAAFTAPSKDFHTSEYNALAHARELQDSLDKTTVIARYWLYQVIRGKF